MVFLRRPIHRFTITYHNGKINCGNGTTKGNSGGNYARALIGRNLQSQRLFSVDS